jgi:exopolysaccharide biosynthesis polyprenyl glycosylphosphotransferase
MGGLNDLERVLESDDVSGVIIALPGRMTGEIPALLARLDKFSVDVRIVPDMNPKFKPVNMQINELDGMPMLSVRESPLVGWGMVTKRAVDLVGSIAGLIVFAIPMAIIALLVRMSGPGPVIFRQERCGLNGRRFVFYKFRSMCEDAHARREEVAHLSERELAWKIPNDPRLTPVGRWLRKFSIDEWPQLWNVLKGDMSLVGPRPAIPEEVEQYKRWQRRRLRMRPGLTCLWVVNGRDRVDFETWMKLDMEYIDNWSLGLDWKIILRTIPSMISGRGAH